MKCPVCKQEVPLRKLEGNEKDFLFITDDDEFYGNERDLEICEECIFKASENYYDSFEY